jgi:hypothetical protein
MKKKCLIMATFMALMMVLSAGFAYGSCTPAQFTLWAGKTINAGTVTVTNDDNYLYVTYNTANGYYLSSAKLGVVETLGGFPTNKQGNLPPGNLPWKADFSSSPTSYTFKIAKTDISSSIDCGTTLYIVAQADLKGVSSEGAWAGDNPPLDGSPGKQWWYYFQYTWCCNGDPVTACEQTAFAKSDTSSTCFITDGFNRWGWTNGPFSPGEDKVMNLYAAAGQCDTGKGMLVGQVEVNYSSESGTVTVTYTTSGDITLTQTHLYVGNASYPQKNGKDTVAPGLYGNTHEGLTTQTDTFTVDATGPIYIIAHAIVEGVELCGFNE